jgi:FtsP/CotA-like multicopper oxidase with cupredoxin domain
MNADHAAPHQSEPHALTMPDAAWPTATRGLPAVRSSEPVELADGERFELRIAPVKKSLGSATVRMLGYNGSVPGPTLRVQQGSRVVVDAINQGDLEATVHWHGLRLDNRYDGTAETQRPMRVGKRFTYRLSFPDPGVYWYHPHIREDYGQEMGLYGNIIVAPSERDYWPPVNRELVLTLDDVLVEDGQIAPFDRFQPTHSAMGRFGNILLVNGEPELALDAKRGEVVRFYLTNTANTRVFNVTVSGARVKLVGADSGRYEREEFVDAVLIAPSERAVVDVLFEETGRVMLEHRTPNRTYPLATITVADVAAEPTVAAEFGNLRTNADMAAERERIASYLDAEPDKTLAFIAEMKMPEPEVTEGATTYACPMHPEVVSTVPDRCPKCGMKLVPSTLVSQAGGPQHHHTAPHDAHAHADHAHAGSDDTGDSRGIEWEDDMVEVNRMTTPANTRWKLIDRATGAEGGEIDWRFRAGDRVKIRLINELESDHPMHHPFHIHGAGRFLILARDGIVENNLVWKDTVLVTKGRVVDILLEVTNPGLWMAHCHIAEHHESGMMFSFRVYA